MLMMISSVLFILFFFFWRGEETGGKWSGDLLHKTFLKVGYLEVWGVSKGVVDVLV